MYMANGYRTNISTKSYRGILRTYLWYFGGCRQIPTEKNVSGSKLCRRDGGILAKSDDIWLSGRHVADTSATFSAKGTDTLTHIQTHIWSRFRDKLSLLRSLVFSKFVTPGRSDYCARSSGNMWILTCSGAGPVTDWFSS